MNKFQESMINPLNIEVANKIAKLYHSNEECKVKVSYLYDWVIISGKGISIGIEFSIPFFGEGWIIDDFVKVYNTSYFKAWRFYDDKLYKIDETVYDVNTILVENNIPRPTPKQMFKYYYSD